jgi:hypothetical protein
LFILILMSERISYCVENPTENLEVDLLCTQLGMSVPRQIVLDSEDPNLKS